MSAGLLTLPVELLYQITENHGMSREDLKTLREVHSSLSGLLAPKVVREIGFHFKGSQKRMNKQRVKRLTNVKDMKDSAIATHTELVFFSVHAKSKTFNGLLEGLDTGLPELLKTFPGINKVGLDIDCGLVDFYTCAMLVESICKHAAAGDRKLIVNLSNFTTRSRLILHHLTNLESLKISLGGRQYQLSKPIVKDIQKIIQSSPSLSVLDLHGFRYGNFLNELFDSIESDDMPAIDKLYLTGSVSYIRNPPGRHLTKSNLEKLTTLKQLDLGGDHEPGSTIWRDLAATPTIKLQVLKGIVIEPESLKYLIQPGLTSSLQVLHLQLPLRNYEWNDISEETCRLLGKSLYCRLIPGIQSHIRDLSICYEGYLKNSGGYDLGDDHIDMVSEKATHFTFGNMEMDYDLPSLIELRAYIFCDEKCTKDVRAYLECFLTALGNATKLKKIHLLLEIEKEDEGHDAGQTVITKVFEELGDIICSGLGVKWAENIIMDIHVAYLNERKEETKEFTFNGSCWAEC